MELPSTLQEAIIYFADPKNCNEFLAGLRWTDGKVECPYCGSTNVSYMASQNRYKCYGGHPKSSVFHEGRDYLRKLSDLVRQVALRDVASSELQERYFLLRNGPRLRGYSEVSLVYEPPNPHGPA